MNLDQHSWLVHKLCGRQGVEHRRAESSSAATTTTRKDASSVVLRTPGTLAEVFVKRVKSNNNTNGDGDDGNNREEQLEDEAQRLSTALMSLQAGVGVGGGGIGGGGGVMEDRGVLSTPLVRQYDEVSSRQHERLVQQQREVEEMRAQVQRLRATGKTLEAAAAAAAASSSSTGRFGGNLMTRGGGAGAEAGGGDENTSYDYDDCEELVSRVTSYAKENELFKEQLALTAMEIKHLHGDLKTRTHNVIVLKHEVQRLKENELTLKNSFADVLREAKQLHSRGGGGGGGAAAGGNENGGGGGGGGGGAAGLTETGKWHELKMESSEWASIAAAAESDHARVKQELLETLGRLDEAKMSANACKAEVADTRWGGAS
jgi:hypothetical protein